MTAELAAAENPSPPNDSGMINPKKRWRLRNDQMSGGRSPSLVVVGRSSIAQSSSTGPSRKACSRSESGRGTNWSNLRQSGVPENRSRSHQTVPASSAIRSVSPITGNSGAIRLMTDRLTILRRRAGRPNTSTSTKKRTTRMRNTEGGSPAPHQPTTNAPGITQAQYPWPRNASDVAMRRRPAMTAQGRHTSAALSYAVRAS